MGLYNKIHVHIYACYTSTPLRQILDPPLIMAAISCSLTWQWCRWPTALFIEGHADLAL